MANFSKHHPEQTLRCASDNLGCSRVHALTKKVVDEYFVCLKSALEENNLMNACF